MDFFIIANIIFSAWGLWYIFKQDVVSSKYLNFRLTKKGVLYGSSEFELFVRTRIDMI